MAGYIRQSSFVDGDTITAALFNNEYNQILSAFSNTSGHAHDGTAAEGPVIGLIGDAGETAPNNKVLIDTTNNYIEFYVQVSSSPVQQLYIADGAIVPVTDSDVDLGTSSLYFKDAYIDSITTTGNVGIGGNLTVTGTTTFNGGTITMGDAATDNVVFGADIDSNIIPDDDNTYDLGSSGQEWRNLYIDGIANIDSLVADTADINGGTVDGAIIGGSSAAAITGTTITGTSFVIGSADISEAELETIDGITAGTVAASKAIVVDSNKDFTGARNITLTGELDAGSLDVSGDVDVDGTTNLDVVDIDGAVDMATTLTVAGNVDFNGDLDVDGTTNLDVVDIDGAVDMATTLTVGGEITAASLDISGNVDIDGTLETDALSINSTTVTSTAAELNILDGVTASATDINLIDGITNGTVIASKAIITDANKDITGGRNITITGELDAATLDISGDADIDGTLETDALSINGTAVTSTAAELNILDGVTSTAAELNILDGVTSTAAELNILDGVTSTAAELNILDGVTASAADINLIDGITNGTVIASKAIITDSNKDISGGRNITISGELDAATLDISGDADIDGTLEADAITVNGTALASVIAGTTVDNATTAAVATTVTITDNENTNENNAIIFTAGGDLDGGNLGLESDGDLKYNPSTGTLSVPNVSVSGTFSTVNSVTMDANNAVIFEGATADAHETTLTSIDATADRTISLPNVSGTIPVLAAASTTQITSTPEELNILDGVTSTAAELNILDGVTSTAAELNILDGVTSTAAELNILDGVTSTAAELNYLDITTLGTTEASKAVTTDSNGDILLPDSDKIKFGAGSDLQIYHDGSNSFIDDAGTGNLQIRGTQVKLQKYTGENMFVGISDGAASMYYDNSQKIATTATGVNVTGVVAATSLDISGDVDVDGTLETDALSINGTAVTSTAAELNILDGVTSTAAELNILDGVTSTAAELNILDGVTSTAAELNVLDGITAVVGELNALDIGATAVGTAVASKAVILDSNKDYTGIRNLTITGELDAATLDISGNVDIDGTLETDNLTVGGAQGSDGQVLTSTGSGVAWEDAGGGAVSAVANGADNRIATFSSSTALNGEANLTFTGTAFTAQSTGALATVFGSLQNNANALDLTTTGGVTAGIFLAAPTADHSFGFQTGGTERARFDSNGRLNVGYVAHSADINQAQLNVHIGSSTIPTCRFSQGDTSSSVPVIRLRHENSTAGFYLDFRTDENAVTGSIKDVSGTLTFASSSDSRLKENVESMSEGLTEVLAMNPVKFTWKDIVTENKTVDMKGAESRGFLAQELNAKYPWAVVEGGEDEKTNPWSVDYGKLTPILVKAIQEQQTIINDLKSRIETLENA